MTWPSRPDGARPVLLDGAKGTELQRHGVSVTDPWWTTAALLTAPSRDLLGTIHREYTAAGADVVTALTFRTNLRALRRAGADEDRSRALVRAAVDVAAAAREGADPPVLAACVTTVEDCYQPSLVPPSDELRAEHGWLAARLAEAGVGLVIAETLNSAREASAIAEACTEAALPVWVSFVCDDDGRLLSGERIEVAAAQAVAAGAGAILVNCTSFGGTDAALAALAEGCDVPIGAYPNLEDRSGLADWAPVDHYVPVRYDPTAFAEQMMRRVTRFGLSIVGGCCGSTPAHIAALRARLDEPALV